MNTDRREFLQTIGAGAVGLGLGAMVPRAAAQAENGTNGERPRLKMAFRIDDVGYSNVCNLGTFETIEHGLATSADTMMDTPGTVDALERLKNFPWISIGWHAHFWGAPVLDPKDVPSLVMKDGDRIRFRKGLHDAKDVVYEEAFKECRAQIERCCKILGRAPDTGGTNGDTPLARAMTKVCEEFGIVTDFLGRQTITPSGIDFADAKGKWAGRKIYMLDASSMWNEIVTDSVTELQKYDPYAYFAEDRAHLKEFPEGAIAATAFHPGWVDYYVYRLGDYGDNAKNFIGIRTVDAETLCS